MVLDRGRCQGTQKGGGGGTKTSKSRTRTTLNKLMAIMRPDLCPS